MKEIIILDKNEGETPLAALERFRRGHREYKGVKMTYAGRLDPMASGLLLALAGDKIHDKEKYLGLDKKYEFEILFGFATDTHDILGFIRHSGVGEDAGMTELEGKIRKELERFRGTIVQRYPLYSSRTVKGKPLFAYGREGSDVDIPEKEITVKKLKLLRLRRITARRLLAETEKRVGRIKGDFRQREIVRLWRRHLSGKAAAHYFFIAAFEIRCSSGTYVRGIADSLGARLGIPALAYRIRRTKIGKFGRITEWKHKTY